MDNVGLSLIPLIIFKIIKQKVDYLMFGKLSRKIAVERTIAELRKYGSAELKGKNPFWRLRFAPPRACGSTEGD